MEDKFLNEVLEKMIEDAAKMYVEEENENVDIKLENEKVEFSDVHNAKMKKLFKEVKNRENKKTAMHVAKRVAIIVLCVMLITAGLVGTVEAWRKEVIKFIMKSNDNNYMSIFFGDDEHSGETEENEEYGESGDISGDIIRKEDNTYIIDGIHFMYVPEGFEFVKKNESGKAQYYSFKKEEDNKLIKLKKETISDIGKLVDIEEASNEKYTFEDKEVFKVKKGSRVYYVWNVENILYGVCSDIEDEKIILKFIENIKILKNI